ncbi:SgcJ/EcaC family oxidoreductase [Ensifer sp.]|jgi:uncharacterized protein (TIGR02246 family)|uniref:SgcJ/EcaC family oxidoreductase n=1 Tax=Ensifer sp. TaxID=1872086 RepID=UPI002E156158|nr:SgcJ/EcaC family oxidoreductase [Ensifer sp.]
MIKHERPFPDVVAIEGVVIAEKHDVEAILALVARVEETQWARDVAGFSALLAPDAVWTTAFGRQLVGWQAIRDFTGAVLPTVLRDFQAFYDTERITFLGEGVAAVNVRQISVDAEGNRRVGEDEGRPLYVLHRHAGAWKIAVAQNTTHQSEKIATQQRLVDEMNDKPVQA